MSADDIKAAKAILANLVTAPKEPSPLTLAIVRQFERYWPNEQEMAFFVAGWDARGAELDGEG